MTPHLFCDQKWHAESRAILARLVGDGLSSGEIAGKLSEIYGREYTRSAVMGQVWRSQLTLARGVYKNEAGRPIRAASLRSMKLQPIAFRRSLRGDLPIVSEPAPAGDIPEGCRWLHGEPAERLFCGADVYGASYCLHHYARAYEAPTQGALKRLKNILRHATR